MSNGTRSEIPLYIKVHAADNVAIIVNEGGLAAGTVFADGLILTEHVPQGHKVALADFASGQDIVRYGEVIGQARQTIQRGSWIEESLVALPLAPELDELPLANNIPAPLSPLTGYTFEGLVVFAVLGFVAALFAAVFLAGFFLVLPPPLAILAAISAIASSSVTASLSALMGRVAWVLPSLT